MLDDPGRFVRYTAMDSLIRLRAAAVEPLARAIATSARPRPALEVAARIGDPRLAARGAGAARRSRPGRARVGRAGARRPRRRAARRRGRRAARRRPRPTCARPPRSRSGGSATGRRRRRSPQLLTDPDWNVRRAAALALRALGAGRRAAAAARAARRGRVRARHGPADARPPRGGAAAVIGDAVEFILRTLNWAILGYFVLVNVALARCSSRPRSRCARTGLDVWRENRWRVLSSRGHADDLDARPGAQRGADGLRSRSARCSRCATRASRSC